MIALVQLTTVYCSLVPTVHSGAACAAAALDAARPTPATAAIAALRATLRPPRRDAELAVDMPVRRERLSLPVLWSCILICLL